MHSSGIDLVFWLAGSLASVAILAVLVGKRRFVAFPVFTAWIALDVLRTVILFFAYRAGGTPYTYCYWSCAFIDLTLQFFVFYEASVHIFRPGPEWARGVRQAFAWIIAVALVIGVALTWLGAPAAGGYLSRIAMRGNFLSSVLMSELFIAMIGMSVKFGMPWRTHVARIVQGLGVYSLLGMMISGLQTYVGYAGSGEPYHALSHVRIVAYLICQGFWIVTLFMEAPEPKTLPEDMYRQLVLVQQRTSLVLGRLSGSGRA